MQILMYSTTYTTCNYIFTAKAYRTTDVDIGYLISAKSAYRQHIDTQAC